MANVKITELTAATALASTDVLPIVDVGADATKKVSVSDLLRNLPDGSAASPSLAFADDQNTGVLSPGDNSLAFATSGTQRLVIDSSGNVGIGQSSPVVALQVSGTSAARIQLSTDNTGHTATDGARIQVDSSNNLELLQRESANIEFFTAGTERLRIDSSGRLLVGLTSGSNRLHVKETNTNTIVGVLQSSATYSYQSLQASGTTAGAVRVGANANDFVVNAGSAERLRIDSSGNVSIGSSTAQVNVDIAPQSASTILRVHSRVNSNAVPAIELVRGTNRTFGADVYRDWSLSNAGGNLLLKSGASGTTTEALRIDSSGRVGIGTTSPNQTLKVVKSSSGGTVIEFSDNVNATGRLGTPSSQVVAFGGNTNHSIAFGGYSTDGSTFSDERLRIDTSGRLLIGTTSGRNVGGGANALVQVETTSQNAISFVSHRGASTSGSIFVLGKSRGTAAGSSTVVASGDELGAIRFAGADGTDVESRAASIAAFVDGTPGTNDMPGRLVFSTTADGANVPTERMRIDSSGNVGIGTTSPAALCHINKTSGTTLYRASVAGNSTIGLEIVKTGSTTQSWRIVDGQTVNGKLEFYDVTDSATRMCIDGSGKVGIGTTSPSYLLDVKQTSAGTVAAFTGSTDGGRPLKFTSANNGIFLGAKWTRDVASSGGIHAWSVDGSEKARIDSSGRLLVGTSTAPSVGSFAQTAKLVSQGNTIESVGGAVLSLQRGEAATSITSGEYLGSICFTDNAGSEFARIDAKANGSAGSNDYPGSLEFSTTTDNLGSPSAKMLVKQNGQISSYCTGQYARVIESSRSAGTSSYLIFGRHSANNITGSGGTQSFAVYTNGNVQNTNNSYGSLSDAKLKENIVDASSQWDDIKDIRVRNYNFIEGQTHTQIGVVAQEVETVSPGLVFDTSDLDGEGNDLGTVTKSVNYSVLYMKAVKALQEAMTRIETLETKVAALEAQ